MLEMTIPQCRIVEFTGGFLRECTRERIVAYMVYMKKFKKNAPSTLMAKAANLRVRLERLDGMLYRLDVLLFLSVLSSDSRQET